MGNLRFEIRDCQARISANCTKTFQRELKRGRPPVDCPACKAEKNPVTPFAAVSTSQGETPSLERTCPCGKTFMLRQGRGRKATKCGDCRAAGTVYRIKDDGEIQALRAETIRREQEELREQAGKDRAERLTLMMGPLLRMRG